VVVAAGPPSFQLKGEALLTLFHSPSMVGFENRFERKGEKPEQRLVGPDFPIIANEDTGAVLNECPNSSPVEVPFCIQGKSMWVS
jgi:hypothetical protein